MNEIPERIRVARLALGMTQLQLAEAMGYEGKNIDRYIQRWEYGERPVPIEKLRLLATVLKIPLDSLIP